MFFSKLMRGCLLCAVILHVSVAARDVIVEFKGAAFIPTGSDFQDIYGKAVGLFGPEVTVDVCNTQKWYAFASVDYLKKDGHSIGLCNDTTVRMVPLAFGLKYFKPVRCADVYAGLGFQPVHLKTRNCSPQVVQDTSQWCLGGIAKLGAYVGVKCNFVLDFFVDYSFVKAGCPTLCQPETGILMPLKANISGVILGVGLGYRFN
jgi:outer membrane protein W